jgi:hypothetical protein
VTDDSAFKKQVRARMAETGEKYTVARRMVIAGRDSGRRDMAGRLLADHIELAGAGEAGAGQPVSVQRRISLAAVSGLTSPGALISAGVTGRSHTSMALPASRTSAVISGQLTFPGLAWRSATSAACSSSLYGSIRLAYEPWLSAVMVLQLSNVSSLHYALRADNRVIDTQVSAPARSARRVSIRSGAAARHRRQGQAEDVGFQFRRADADRRRDRGRGVAVRASRPEDLPEQLR